MHFFTIFERIHIMRRLLETQFAAQRTEDALITSQMLDILIHHVTLLRQCRLFVKPLRCTALRQRQSRIAA